MENVEKYYKVVYHDNGRLLSESKLELGSKLSNASFITEYKISKTY